MSPFPILVMTARRRFILGMAQMATLESVRLAYVETNVVLREVGEFFKRPTDQRFGVQSHPVFQ